MLPLEGIRVLDFSTLLPGPLASLILAEAGAEVIKVERPGGEDMRAYAPHVGEESVNFALLNRGKRSIEIDLREAGAAASLLALAPTLDIVLEQFRPGVMARLGLGYDAWREANPRLVYCAITGYGQDGPDAARAGHDLNYQAGSGALALSAGVDGAPGMPPVLLGDIAGGSYPAVVNILLALRQRERTGVGGFLDIAMAENLLPFLFWGLAQGQATGHWPQANDAQFTGASPRYRIYRAGCGRHLTVAPLETKFWQAFCEAIGLPEDLRDDARNPAATIAEVTRLLAARPAAHWDEVFRAADCCVSVVRTLDEAVRDLHLAARGVFDREVVVEGHVLMAMPLPLVRSLRRGERQVRSPALGEARVGDFTR
ncbi:MAG: CoA transferase [Betaproteobacteria bacterium]|nr:CoA transferase [Betaproteobacteria bacterium]